MNRLRNHWRIILSLIGFALMASMSALALNRPWWQATLWGVGVFIVGIAIKEKPEGPENGE